MNGYNLAIKTAMMLQDHVLIQMLLDEDINETHSAFKFRSALSDALSEVSRDFPVYLKTTVTAETDLIERSDIVEDGSLTVASVTADGKAVPYTVDQTGIRVGAPGTYEVTYSPEIFNVEIYENFDVAPEVGFVMMMHLIARNYCMMSGRMEEAAMYDSRYNDFAEKIRLKCRAQIPVRRFF